MGLLIELGMTGADLYRWKKNDEFHGKRSQGISLHEEQIVSLTAIPR